METIKSKPEESIIIEKQEEEPFERENLPAHLRPPPRVKPSQIKKNFSKLIDKYKTELNQIHPNWENSNPQLRAYHTFERNLAQRICWLINRIAKLKEGKDWDFKILFDQKGIPFGIPEIPPKDRARR